MWQVIEHKLHPDFDYHHVPAPWLQVKLLRVLGVLCRGDEATSAQVWEVLKKVLQRCDSTVTIAHAVTYECISTIVQIDRTMELMDGVCERVARFLYDEQPNVRCLGLTALGLVMQVEPQRAGEYEQVFISGSSDLSGCGWGLCVCG